MGNKEFKIVITDSETSSVEIEEHEARKFGAALERYDCRSEAEVIKVCRDADAILVDIAPITKKVINELKKCQVIVRYGIGYDNIDVAAASKAGIYVVNLPTYCIDEVSTHAVALLLAIGRKLVQYDKDVKKGIWNYQLQLPVLNLRDCRVGVIGFGNIARLFIDKIKSFKPEIVVYDPFVDDQQILDYGLKSVKLKELIQTSDAISVHCPLTDDTRHLFGKYEFEMMKDTAFLVNTARGAVIDEQALYEAVKEKKIAGAALDTTSIEPPAEDNCLFSLDNVILSPHVAFYSEGSLQAMHELAIKEAIKVLKGEEPNNILNKKI